MAFQSSKEMKKLNASFIEHKSQSVQYCPIDDITSMNSPNGICHSVDSLKTSSVDLECSLFMDETNADLDNYLNTTLPDCSNSIFGHDSKGEQDFECKTMNNLSKNIKGKYQKNMRGTKKNNKFFKSKLSDEKILLSPNEIPVINEAMKKIFKPLTDKPDITYSPRVSLKTYSNKHRDRSTSMVESFGLPDEPLIPLNSNSTSQNSIDLDISEGNLDNSLLITPWINQNQIEVDELSIGEEYRRRSFTCNDVSPFIGENIIDDVKEGFNFEENIEIQTIQGINNEIVRKGSRIMHKHPKILLTPLNLDDRCMFRANHLSPIKNKKTLLFERLENYTRSFDSMQGSISDDSVSAETEGGTMMRDQSSQIKNSQVSKKDEMNLAELSVNLSTEDIYVSKKSSRRSTRLHNTSFPQLDGVKSNRITDTPSLENAKRNYTGKDSKQNTKPDATSSTKQDIAIGDKSEHNKNGNRRKNFENNSKSLDRSISELNNVLFSPKRITRNSTHNSLPDISTIKSSTPKKYHNKRVLHNASDKPNQSINEIINMKNGIKSYKHLNVEKSEKYTVDIKSSSEKSAEKEKNSTSTLKAKKQEKEEQKILPNNTNSFDTETRKYQNSSKSSVCLSKLRNGLKSSKNIVNSVESEEQNSDIKFTKRNEFSPLSIEQSKIPKNMHKIPLGKLRKSSLKEKFVSRMTNSLHSYEENMVLSNEVSNEKSVSVLKNEDKISNIKAVPKLHSSSGIPTTIRATRSSIHKNLIEQCKKTNKHTKKNLKNNMNLNLENGLICTDNTISTIKKLDSNLEIPSRRSARLTPNNKTNGNEMRKIEQVVASKSSQIIHHEFCEKMEENELNSGSMGSLLVKKTGKSEIMVEKGSTPVGKCDTELDDKSPARNPESSLADHKTSPQMSKNILTKSDTCTTRKSRNNILSNLKTHLKREPENNLIMNEVFTKKSERLQAMVNHSTVDSSNILGSEVPTQKSRNIWNRKEAVAQKTGSAPTECQIPVKKLENMQAKIGNPTKNSENTLPNDEQPENILIDKNCRKKSQNSLESDLNSLQETDDVLVQTSTNKSENTFTEEESLVKKTGDILKDESFTENSDSTFSREETLESRSYPILSRNEVIVSNKPQDILTNCERTLTVECENILLKKEYSSETLKQLENILAIAEMPTKLCENNLTDEIPVRNSNTMPRDENPSQISEKILPEPNISSKKSRITTSVDESSSKGPENIFSEDDILERNSDNIPEGEITLTQIPENKMTENDTCTRKNESTVEIDKTPTDELHHKLAKNEIHTTKLQSIAGDETATRKLDNFQSKDEDHTENLLNALPIDEIDTPIRKLDHLKNDDEAHISNLHNSIAKDETPKRKSSRLKTKSDMETPEKPSAIQTKMKEINSNSKKSSPNIVHANSEIIEQNEVEKLSCSLVQPDEVELKASDTLNAASSDNSHSPKLNNGAIMGNQVKRKRGRPRLKPLENKCMDDNNSSSKSSGGEKDQRYLNNQQNSEPAFFENKKCSIKSKEAPGLRKNLDTSHSDNCIHAEIEKTKGGVVEEIIESSICEKSLSELEDNHSSSLNNKEPSLSVLPICEDHLILKCEKSSADLLKNQLSDELNAEKEYGIEECNKDIKTSPRKFSSLDESKHAGEIDVQLKEEKVPEKQNEKSDEFLDVGYDTHRRTSFRKILERVMELSKIDVEMNEGESPRLQRCKSVPHEKCNSTETNCKQKSASVDNKFKYLKNMRSSVPKNVDILKVKKRLDYSTEELKPIKRNRTKSLHKTKLDLESNKVWHSDSIGRSKSALAGSDLQEFTKECDDVHDCVRSELVQMKDINVYEKIEKSEKSLSMEQNIERNHIVSRVPKATEIRTKIVQSLDTSSDEQKNSNTESQLSISTENQNSVVDRQMHNKKIDEDHISVSSSKSPIEREVPQMSSRTSNIDELDLEVQKSQLDAFEMDTPNRLTQRNRCYSEGNLSQMHKMDSLSRRCKSVIGKSKRRSKRDSRRLRRMSQSTVGGIGFSSDGVLSNAPVTSKAAKKVIYEFKVGDSIWGKMGNYPYWPCIIVLDPDSSQYKKYKLLRTTPYYHVRFFGDNGRRAWTTHVLPYEGSDDLEKLAAKFWREGIQTSYIRESYCIKPSQLEKWKQAVAEAEMVKNEPVEKKINFFNELFAHAGASHVSDDKDASTSFSKLKTKRNRDHSTSRSTKNEIKEEDETNMSPAPKRKVPMKETSVHSCIDDVITKYCTSGNGDGSSQESIKPLGKQFRSQKKRRREEMPTDSQSDLALELIDLPPMKMEHTSVTRLSQSPTKLNQIPVEGIANISRTKNQKAILNYSKSDFILAENLKTSPPGMCRLRSKSLSQIDKKTPLKEFVQKAEFQVFSKERKLNSSPIILPSPPKLRERKSTLLADQSDCESKASDNSFINSTQLSHYKKNLFRGVTKEKICQICEQPVDVVKCRGPCNGDYHLKCVEESFKNTEKLTQESSDLDSSKSEKSDSGQVQIITVGSQKKLLSTNLTLSPGNRTMSLTDQIDRKMKEIMTQVEYNAEFTESTDSSGEEMNFNGKVKAEGPSKATIKNNSKSRKSRGVFKHVTADDVSIINLTEEGVMKQNPVQTDVIEAPLVDECVYKCPYCVSSVVPPCFVCNAIVSKKGNAMRQRCSLQKCGRFYHLECLNIWPQTQWSFILHEKRKTEALDSFVCPRHFCHICASENLGSSIGRCPSDKLVKCLRCPATYHHSYHCVPAGTQILTSTQIICPRHIREKNKKPNTCNTVWCFVCSEGGNLICCETCPTSVHAECLHVNLMDDDTYLCEDCESGRFPLYDEVVWVKCGSFRWWPAIILFPSEVPPNVEAKPHSKGDFVVKFFGTYDYYWVGRGRTFLYQEGDTGCLNSSKNRIDEAFSRALKEAADVYHLKKESKSKRDKEVNNGLKPPSYVRIKVNRPVGNVRTFEGNLSNTTSCDCNPRDSNPCGPNSNCLNRILLTECNTDVCPAGQKCKNQCFEKREYPQMIPYRTAGRGWGLKTLEPLRKGQFVIEYVGELIDDEEYQRRIKRMHEQKDENYYFLTIGNDRMLDAGPKGNAARFMNHSCQPNCETQKWTVNGDTRVGLFALEDIPADTELTFNYNLECVGTEKKICRCGAPNCSGYIGVKPEDQRPPKRNPTDKKKEPESRQEVINKDPCFVCGKTGVVRLCSNKSCSRSYHLKCVQLDSWPDAKWACPSHNCNICSRRTIRSCVQCMNSFCPAHSEGNVRHDSQLGFICTAHDPTKRKRGRPRKNGVKSQGNSNFPKNEVECVEHSNDPSGVRLARHRKRKHNFEIPNGPPSKKMSLDSNSSKVTRRPSANPKSVLK